MFIVNIVLLLILFFLATGRLLNSTSYGVDLSQTQDLPVETLPKPLLIVDENGGLVLNGEPIAAELLGPALEEEPTVHLLIAGDTPAIDLIDLLAQPGLDTTEVRLVTVRHQGREE